MTLANQSNLPGSVSDASSSQPLSAPPPFQCAETDSGGDWPNNGKASGPTASASSSQHNNNTDRQSNANGENRLGGTNEGVAVNPLHVSNSTFSTDEKLFIVENLARFQSHSETADALAKAFNRRKPDLRSIANYDPASRNCRMGKRYHKAYAIVRKGYIERIADVGLAHQAHRLRLIEKLIDKATTAKEYASAIKGLELAAKEMGALSSVPVEVRHTGTVAHVHASIADAKAELAMRLNHLVATNPALLPAADLVPCTLDAAPVATEGGG